MDKAFLVFVQIILNPPRLYIPQLKKDWWDTQQHNNVPIHWLKVWIICSHSNNNICPPIELFLHVVTVPLRAWPMPSWYTGKMDTWYRVWEERLSSSTLDWEPATITSRKRIIYCQNRCGHERKIHWSGMKLWPLTGVHEGFHWYKS